MGAAGGLLSKQAARIFSRLICATPIG